MTEKPTWIFGIKKISANKARGKEVNLHLNEKGLERPKVLG